RDYHIGIKGVDEQGRRYSALNPDVFYWAHSTFFMGTILTAERFGDGLTEDQKRRLFDEHITWYRMYGMSMRPVPGSWEEFQQYWDHMCRNVLENTWAARQVLDLSTMPKHPSLQWIPDWLWKLQLKVLGPFAVWVTVGLYDPPVRELMGYTWSERDERLHRLFGRAVNLAFKLLPKRRRMHPRARAGWDRATGRIPADAPLVHTPARNLPPVEHRDKPIHYCPDVRACAPGSRDAASDLRLIGPGTIGAVCRWLLCGGSMPPDGTRPPHCAQIVAEIVAVVPPLGLEPRTSGLKVRSSTN